MLVNKINKVVSLAVVGMLSVSLVGCTVEETEQPNVTIESTQDEFETIQELQPEYKNDSEAFPKLEITTELKDEECVTIEGTVFDSFELENGNMVYEVYTDQNKSDNPLCILIPKGTMKRQLEIGEIITVQGCFNEEGSIQGDCLMVNSANMYVIGHDETIEENKINKHEVPLEYKECLEQAQQCLEYGEYSKQRLKNVLEDCYEFEEEAINYAIQQIYN